LALTWCEQTVDEHRDRRRPDDNTGAAARQSASVHIPRPSAIPVAQPGFSRRRTAPGRVSLLIARDQGL
jgi:hypothetical protein